MTRPTLAAAVRAAIPAVVPVARDRSGPGGWSRVVGVLPLAARAAPLETLRGAIAGRGR